MVTRNLYLNCVGAVCRETGINECDMLHGNSEECVDARFLLVKALLLRLTDSEAAELIGRTRQCVNAIRNSRKPMKWSVRMNWEAVRKQVM